MDTQTAWLLFSKLNVIGDADKRALLERFPSPVEIFAAGPRDLAPLSGRRTAAILRAPHTIDLHAESAWLAPPHHALVPLHDPRYPEALRRIASPPLVLFAAGDTELLARPGVALVGSRNPTPPGRDSAARFAAALARRGLVVISGLAMGIDAAAHRGALAAGGCTIAVVGCGPDRVYPRCNAALHRGIVKHGLVVTEFPPGTAPRAGNFPLRNRIISGLSLGVLVVEAAARSGSLITARLAAEQGREVFALPGPIQSPLSRGCHRLIRDGAKLVEEVDHILEELPPGCFAVNTEPADEAAPAPALSGAEPHELKILEAMGFAPATIDQIIERSGLTARRVSAILINMELKEWITPCADGTYARVR